jgi:hypothetical protein
MPGSIVPMSKSTGAPAAFARSLGNQLATNGTATAAPPAAPTATVAAIRNLRLSFIGPEGSENPPAAVIEGELLIRVHAFAETITAEVYRIGPRT